MPIGTPSERLVGDACARDRDRGAFFGPRGDDRVERVKVRIVRRNRAQRLTAEIDRRNPAVRHGRSNLRDAVRAPHDPRTRGTFDETARAVGVRRLGEDEVAVERRLLLVGSEWRQCRRDGDVRRRRHPGGIDLLELLRVRQNAGELLRKARDL